MLITFFLYMSSIHILHQKRYEWNRPTYLLINLIYPHSLTVYGLLSIITLLWCKLKVLCVKGGASLETDISTE